MAGAGIEVYFERKWRAENELLLAEERLREKALLEAAATGRAGLEYFHTDRVYRTKRKEPFHTRGNMQG